MSAICIVASGLRSRTFADCCLSHCSGAGGVANGIGSSANGGSGEAPRCSDRCLCGLWADVICHACSAVVSFGGGALVGSLTCCATFYAP